MILLHFKIKLRALKLNWDLIRHISIWKKNIIVKIKVTEYKLNKKVEQLRNIQNLLSK